MFKLETENCLISKAEIAAYETTIQNIIKKFKRNRATTPLAFLDLPYNEGIITAIEEFARDHRKKFENVLVLGIGGSSLGGIALIKTLKHVCDIKPNIFFLSNIDPDHVNYLLKNLNLKKTLIVVISKSGETVETLSTFFVILKKLKTLVPKKWKKQIITITDQRKGFLNSFAKENHIPRFPIPSLVSGRFSVLSPVGLLPAAFAGINIKKIAAGAKKMDKMWQESDLGKNLPAALAILQYILDTEKNKNSTVLFPYSQSLSNFADWYIQLLAESIGKKETVGIQPVKAIGTLDQHSQLQLFMEGPNTRFFIFLEIEKFDNTVNIPEDLIKNTPFEFLKNHTLNDLFKAEKKATEQALTKAARPNVTLIIQQLNEEGIGALLYFFEIQIAFLAELYNINAFDQPGVELGKKLTKQQL